MRTQPTAPQTNTPSANIPEFSSEEDGEVEDIDDDDDSNAVNDQLRALHNSKKVSMQDLIQLVGVLTSQSIETNKMVATVAQKSKRGDRASVATEVLQDEEPVKISEEYKIEDDSHSVIDLALRHRLRAPNSAPEDWWTNATSTRHSRPRLGLNMYLDHIALTRVSAITIR